MATTQLPSSFTPALEAPGVATLATRNPAGAIQQTALWYLLEDGALKLSIAGSRAKLRNLQRDPTCTFFLFDPASAQHTLEVRAKASVVQDDGSFAGRVGAKYGADLSSYDPPGEVRYVVTLTPEKVNETDLRQP